MRIQKINILVFILILLAVQACNPKNNSDNTGNETEKSDSVSIDNEIYERQNLSEKDSSETRA
jgi:hypothetical protein